MNYATSNGTATTGDRRLCRGLQQSAFRRQREHAERSRYTINGDTKVEPNETFNVGLSGATNGATISDGQGTATITNDDAAPTAGSVSINDVTISEGQQRQKVATFTVTRSGGTAAFDVNYATSDGTATSPTATMPRPPTRCISGPTRTRRRSRSRSTATPRWSRTRPSRSLLSNATNGATISDGQGTAPSPTMTPRRLRAQSRSTMWRSPKGITAASWRPSPSRAAAAPRHST